MELHEMILIVAILDGPILGLIYFIWKRMKSDI
jgi:hypothetical protein